VAFVFFVVKNSYKLVASSRRCVRAIDWLGSLRPCVKFIERKCTFFKKIACIYHSASLLCNRLQSANWGWVGPILISKINNCAKNGTILYYIYFNEAVTMPVRLVNITRKPVALSQMFQERAEAIPPPIQSVRQQLAVHKIFPIKWTIQRTGLSLWTTLRY